MLRSHNVLTKGTDSDNTAQQSLVMQRDANLYPLFTVSVTVQFNSIHTTLIVIIFVMFVYNHQLQLAQNILAIVNPLKPELNPICYLLVLLGAHHFLHVSRIRVKSLTLRLLMSYIYDITRLRVKLKRAYILFYKTFSSIVLFLRVLSKLWKASISFIIFVWSVLSHGTNRRSRNRFP
jgi:hypothetical protein